VAWPVPKAGAQFRVLLSTSEYFRVLAHVVAKWPVHAKEPKLEYPKELLVHSNRDCPQNHQLQVPVSAATPVSAQAWRMSKNLEVLDKVARTRGQVPLVYGIWARPGTGASTGLYAPGSWGHLRTRSHW
jgi:hypothetical protein